MALAVGQDPAFDLMMGNLQKQNALQSQAKKAGVPYVGGVTTQDTINQQIQKAMEAAQKPQQGGYNWNGQSFATLEDQQIAMKKAGQFQPSPGSAVAPTVAATPTAPAIGAIIANPPTAPSPFEAARSKFQASLGPQITEGINIATSQVSPFMTGRRSATIQENVLKPATQALAQFDIEQAKTAEERAYTEAQQAKELARGDLDAQIAALAPLAAKGDVGAKAKLTELYNQRFGSQMPTSPTATPGQVPATGATGGSIGDILAGGETGVTPTEKMKLEQEKLQPEINQASANYTRTGPKVLKYSSWIEGDTESPAGKAWQDYERIGNKLEALEAGRTVAITAEEIARFNELDATFNKYATSLGQHMTDPAFTKYYPVDIKSILSSIPKGFSISQDELKRLGVIK